MALKGDPRPGLLGELRPHPGVAKILVEERLDRAGLLAVEGLIDDAEASAPEDALDPVAAADGLTLLEFAELGKRRGGAGRAGLRGDEGLEAGHQQHDVDAGLARGMLLERPQQALQKPQGV